jgi:hypothetical protein
MCSICLRTTGRPSQHYIPATSSRPGTARSSNVPCLLSTEPCTSGQLILVAAKSESHFEPKLDLGTSSLEDADFHDD